MLVGSVFGPVTELDVNPIIDFDPSGSLLYLEWTLSTTNSAISDSDSIYTILSPPGVGPVERLHFQSLALERHLGVQAVAVPEPGSFAVLAIGASAAMIPCKRRS